MGNREWEEPKAWRRRRFDYSLFPIPGIKKMADIGVEVRQTTPEQFSDILERDAKKYGDLVRELGITVD